MEKKHEPQSPSCPSHTTTALLEAFAQVPESEQLAWAEMLPEADFAALSKDLAELCGLSDAIWDGLTEAQLRHLCSLSNEEAVTYLCEVIGERRQ